MFKLTDAQKNLLRRDSEITIECLPEDSLIKGNVLASGDDLEDARAEQEVIRQLKAGNEWAWCTIKVTVTWKDYTGTDYLGQCSYKSKADFIESNDYFPDMVETAYAGLFASIQNDIDNAMQVMETLGGVK